MLRIRYFEFFRRRATNMKAATIEADLLTLLMADGAHDLAYGKSRNLKLSDDERSHAMRVRRILEKRLGIAPQVDTATRYLEG